MQFLHTLENAFPHFTCSFYAPFHIIATTCDTRFFNVGLLLICLQILLFILILLIRFTHLDFLLSHLYLIRLQIGLDHFLLLHKVKSICNQTQIQLTQTWIFHFYKRIFHFFFKKCSPTRNLLH